MRFFAMFQNKALSLAFSAALCGCYGTVSTPSGSAEITSAPVDYDAPAADVDIEAGPQFTYEGHPTYLHGDRWYYRDNGHWRTYRTEPNELRQHRLQMNTNRQQFHTNDHRSTDRDHDRR
jgi:hypothetical protein